MESEMRFDQPIGQILPIADRLATQAGHTINLNKKPKLGDSIITAVLFLCGMLSILTTIGFTVVLGSEAIRFFASVEWLNANKQTASVIEANTTTFSVTTSGSELHVGDILRIGQNGTEIVEITKIPSVETIEVIRGIRDTTAGTYPSNTALFIGEQVTLAKFFTDTKWAPQIGRFGIIELIVPTLVITIIAMFVAVPLGLGAAIRLSEYSSARTRTTLKPILEILAGVPTVVYGYFALTFVTPLLQSIFGIEVQVYNMLSAGLVTGILIIPTVASISDDALRAVPRALREASYGLGATRLETVGKVLLPSALSGIVAAVILGISRAVGETMIVLIASGAGPNLTVNPFDSAETMAGHIARISTGDLSYGSIDYNSVFAVGLTLFVATLLLNILSTTITRRFREVYS